MTPYENTLILGREDLRMPFINNIGSICREDFKSNVDFTSYDTVVFIDVDGSMKIFKKSSDEPFNII